MSDSPLKRKKKWGKVNTSLLMLALPTIITVFIFNYMPIFGVSIAFLDYNPVLGFAESSWVELKNFEFFFKSNDAFTVIRNTILYNLLFIVLNNTLYLVFAFCWYDMSKRATKAVQTTLLIPSTISWVLVASIGFALFSHENGLFTEMIKNLTGKEILWYSEPKYWPFILTIFNFWKNAGTGTILFYAALMALDSALLEAATLDGANKFQKIWYVSLPSIMPTVVIVVIMAVGSIMNGDFGLYYQLPMNSGALYPATDVLETYVYRGLVQGSYSQTAAVGLFKNVVGLILVLLSDAFAKKIDPEYGMF